MPREDVTERVNRLVRAVHGSTRAQLLLALVPPLVTFVIQWTGWELFRPYAWFLFVPAVTFSARIGGLRGGLVATVFSTALVWWFFLPPEHMLVKEARLVLPTAVFMATGTMISVFAERFLRANERLRRLSNERRIFAALIDNSSDFIGIADPAGTPVYINPAGRRMVDLPSNTPIETTQIPEYYPPDQRTFVEDVIVKRMVDQGHWQGETYFRNWHTGAAIPVSDTHFMIRDPDTGTLLGMGTVTRDISDVREAREQADAANQRLRALFENAPDGIFIADQDGRYTDVNAAACRIVGYSRNELLEMSMTDVIRPEDVARLDADKQRLLAGETVMGDWWVRRKDGSTVPVEVSSKILADGRWQGFAREITGRKQLEADVHQAQERTELALDGADLAAWDWNFETGEVLFNARWAQMRGYSTEDLTPNVESWNAGIHPDDLPRVRQALNDHFAGRTSKYECEFRVQTKAGSWIWVLDRGKVYARDAKGQPLRMLGTVLDVTTRKQADIELRLAHETTSGILSISADAIISLDEQQHITMFNAGAEKIFGYSKAEAIGAPVDMLIPERLRTNHRRLVEQFAAGPNAARQMGSRGREILGRRKNGDEFPAEAAISKLEVGGHRILTVTLRDVTEQQRAAYEQRFLAEVGPVLASSLDYEQTLDQVAQLAVRELADLCIVDLVSPDGEVRRLKAVCRDPARGWIAEGLMRLALDQSPRYITNSALAHREPMLIERVTDEILASYAHSDEHLKLMRALEPASIIAVPLVAHDKLLGAIALVASGTSRRFGPADLRLAQELAYRAALAIESARLYAVAQHAIQARDDVLGVVAHDLRNPLNTINLHADLLLEGEGNQRKVGEAILRSVTRMNRLIQDILDVTRLDAGQLTVDRKRVATIQVVLDVVEAHRPLAEAKGLALLVELEPDLPDVWADHDRLLQICENLVGNALKFTKHGSVTLGAAAHDGEVLLWVKDTGVGLPADALPHLFDRFWQASVDRRQGAGLGLAIVKGLVEAHGGRIWAESTVGSGSCFYFTIPRAPQVEAWHSASTEARP